MSAWLAEMLAASAVLMLVVLLIRRPVARAFGARAAFALWLAPLLRVVMPPLPANAPAADIWVETSQAAAEAVAPAQAAMPLSTMLIAIWALGAAGFLAFHALAYARFVRRAVAEGRLMSGENIRGIAIFETSAVTGPAAAGLLKKRIFVPSGFGHEFARDEQRLALWHEALHHRRRDLWKSAVALVVLALHWFNPLAHAAHRAFRRDLEAACDAELLSRAGGNERELYARTILRCAARPVPQPICALTDTQELKGRLEMMKRNYSLVRRACGGAIAITVTGAGLLLANPALAQDTADKAETTEKRIVVHQINGDAKDRRLPEDLRARVEKCEGQPVEAEFENKGSDKKERTRVILCAKGSGAEAASRLEESLKRIESDSDLPADAKAQVVAKLRSKIAELRTGK